MINIRLLLRSVCGVPFPSARHSLSTVHSSRFLFVRNRFLWHQKSRFVLFHSDYKSRLSINQIGFSSMSSFTYPVAKRTDFVENLHGIAVKKKLIPSNVSWNIVICYCYFLYDFNLIFLNFSTRLMILTAGLKTQTVKKHRNLFVFKMSSQHPIFRVVQLCPVLKQD
jgi:hypothetical protein